MLTTSAKDATNFWYSCSISTKESHTSTIVYVPFHPLALQYTPTAYTLVGIN